MKSVHEDIDDVRATDDDRFACPLETRKKAMDFLALRDYGQAELIDKLTNKGFKRAVAETEVVRLTDEGLQSDSRFAEAFVQSRVNQGKGPVRIRAELRQKGIADGVIATAIEDNGADWYELAREVRARKFGSGKLSDFKDKARQMRFLQYRGFDSDHIQSVF